MKDFDIPAQREFLKIFVVTSINCQSLFPPFLCNSDPLIYKEVLVRKF